MPVPWSAAWRPLSLLLLLLATAPYTLAIRMFQSNSLNPCMDGSLFSATLFRVSFTPDNGSLSININGLSQINSKVLLEIDVLGYGYSVYHNILDPCREEALAGLCPMRIGPFDLPSNTELPKDSVSQLPNAIYYIPDLDGKVRVWINSTSGIPLACVEAELSNGKTVDQKAVAWVVAVIAGLALLSSAVISGLGHSTAAAHVAAYALTLFGFFQAQAIVGMTAISFPPIVRAWTLNFQWSMGIISVGFLQTMATWYQRSTGGSPARLISNLDNTSVRVQKRALQFLHGMLQRRTNSETNDENSVAVVAVQGIERVGFLSHIEATNIFFTGYIFFTAFALFVAIGVLLFKYICEALVRTGRMHPDKFRDFRNGWRVVLKGILIRIVLIGFPQMVILCFWELTRRDSAAEIVLAVSTILFMSSILAWGCYTVCRIAQRSKDLHHNPAYMLYADPKSLNKWGFLYVQFSGGMYYFIIPTLVYILARGLFIAFGQTHGRVQAVGLLVLDAILLTTLAVMKPYMDKKTNALNIAIASVNFVNSLLLLFFTGAFGIPPLGIGVLGVAFFVINCIFTIIIILMVIWTSIWALFVRNPDTRLQPALDDRRSFIKSQTNLGNPELDALGATARGAHYDPFMSSEKNLFSERSDSASRSVDRGPVAERMT